MGVGPGLGRALVFGLMASAAFPIGLRVGLFWTPPRKVVAAVIAFGMKHVGRSATCILTAWRIAALACVASVILGYELLAGMSDAFQSTLLALAAGGIPAMLSDTMFPEAFRTGDPWVAMSTARASRWHSCSAATPADR